MNHQIPIDFTAIPRKPDPPSGPKLTERERLLLSLLPHGRQNAISMPNLAEQVGVPTRELQEMIQNFINNHGILIASSCGKPSGYYYPESFEDFQEGVKQLVNRIISLAKRLKAMDKEKHEQIFGQGRLLG